ncbi:MAG: hypothetical protein JNL01_02950 [Bdellovibrionales bacterium]|nr:hypothetical protein [Bdellovibrionales bacterium]
MKISNRIFTLGLSLILVAVPSYALDMKKLQGAALKGAAEGIKTGKIEGAKKGIEVGAKTTAEEMKKGDAGTPAAGGAPAASAEPAKDLSPSLICDAAKKMGICYAFTGQKHVDDHAQGKEKAAKSTKKNQPICANDFACKIMRGEYKEASTCPKEKALGRCLIKKGDPEEFTLFYYKGGKIKDAQKDCADAKSSIHRQGAGEWTAL